MALNHDQMKVREYLLGHLSDEEQQKIEERLMVENDLFEELEISKGELVEQYCAGELTQNEHHWFEQHYLASFEGKQQHTFTVALNCLKPPTPIPQHLTFYERLRSFFNRRAWVLSGATGAALVVVIAVNLFLSRPAPQTMAVILTNSAARRGPGDVDISRLTLNPNVGELRMSLKLPDSATPNANYRAELDNGRNTKTVKVAGYEANSVVVLVPAADLSPGYYALRLFVIQTDAKEQQLPGDYRLIVE